MRGNKTGIRGKRVKLTAEVVRDAEPPATGEANLWDDALRGFGLRIRPNGSKLFFVQYRTRAGTARKLSVGQYGRMTPEKARKAATQLLAAVSRGEDPALDREKARQAPTMAELAARYLAEHAEPKKKASSVRNDRQLLRDYILPWIGKRSIVEVTSADVAKLHHHHRGKPYQANRMLALLSKMLNLAEKWGLRPLSSNPCRHLERHREEKRRRYLSGEELARLGAVLAAQQAEYPFPVAAVRLLLFTGARLNEILALRWEWVDLARGVAHLPDSKTGQKDIVFSGPALAILETLPRIKGNPYVLPGAHTGKHLVGLQHIWARWCRAAEIEGARLHDLRHTAASIGVAAGLGLPIIGGLLGHTSPSTTQRYAHVAIDPKRAAADVIGAALTGAMGGRS